jgi:hypothetical protein
MANQLPPDFKEFLSLLDSNCVEYLLIGSYAVNFYAFPRTTGDIDIWVSDAPANVVRLAAALRSFGFSGADAHLFDGHDMLRAGVPPLRLEVLTKISGVEFDDCYGRRRTEIIDGIPVAVISKEDLRINKKASGRPKDLADLEALRDD